MPVQGMWLKAGILAAFVVYSTAKAQTVPTGISGHHPCIVNHMLVLPQFEGKLLVEISRRCICTPKAQINKDMARQGFVYKSLEKASSWDMVGIHISSWTAVQGCVCEPSAVRVALEALWQCWWMLGLDHRHGCAVPDTS